MGVQNSITVDAVQSAKRLGADKRISMWRPDSQVGFVVIKAPEMPEARPRGASSAIGIS
jgi:hypothetical protein